jgi:hypothetical protein
MAEIVYLTEKKRLPANDYVDLKAALDDRDHVFKRVPFTVEVVDVMKQVSREDDPTCLTGSLRLRLCLSEFPSHSHEGKTRSSNVHTIW